MPPPEPASPATHASQTWGNEGPPVLAILGHPMNWGMLLLGVTLLLLLMAVVSALGAWWAWLHLSAHVVLTEQAADVRLPQSLTVQAKVQQKMKVLVDQPIAVTIPIHQTLTLPIREALPVQVTVDTTVPVNVDVPVRQTLKLDQVVHVNSQVHTKVFGIPMTLPIQGDVPVQAEVPIDMVIPIRHKLPLALLTAATVNLDAPLEARINTEVRATVPVKQTLSLPVAEPVEAVLSFPQQNVQAGLNLMTLAVPFQSVRILPREAAASAPR